ncbi:hypothetical protein [Solidesulfovibrio sp.]|uniref:hypothetical protein n=1 Tax=Solidesulfovibrio sp. TaxID=2910990 RepID=UPI00262FCF90|nr:hypothetical protein [Solidesulfovibrio sp.]
MVRAGVPQPAAGPEPGQKVVVVTQAPALGPVGDDAGRNAVDIKAEGLAADKQGNDMTDVEVDQDSKGDRAGRFPFILRQQYREPHCFAPRRLKGPVRSHGEKGRIAAIAATVCRIGQGRRVEAHGNGEPQAHRREGPRDPKRSLAPKGKRLRPNHAARNPQRLKAGDPAASFRFPAA